LIERRLIKKAMKKILSVMLMTFIFSISLGAVSAVGCNVTITNPSEEYLDNSTEINWVVDGSDCLSIDYDIYLMNSNENNCSNLNDWRDYSEVIENDIHYNQQPVELYLGDYDEGNYCILVSSENSITFPDADIKEITIDHTAPIINYFAENKPESKSIESDTWDSNTRTLVQIDAEDNEEIVFCEINWGDGRPNKNCSSNYSERNYGHHYRNNGNYELTLTVRDKAGHETNEQTTINVENVAPWDVEVHSLQTVAAVGELVRFNATAEDVNADLPLEYRWIVDGEDVEGKISELGDPYLDYRWLSASEHEVSVCASDGDDETCSDALKMTIEKTEHMTSMQRAVAEKYFKFNLDEKWDVPFKKRFKTTIENLSDCKKVVGPVGMNISGVTGTSRCQVEWKPTNDDRGIWALESEDQNPIIIKVSNGTDYKYYSFDVTVYSWGIELVPGWNLISIPLMPADTSIDAVFADIHKNIYKDGSTWTVYQYDAIEGKWLKNRAISNGWSGATSATLKHIVPGYAYWIKMENEDTIYGSEDFFPVSTSPGESSVELAKGSWNLIGRYGITPIPINWETAFKSMLAPITNKNYVGETQGIYELLNVTASGSTTWGNTTQIKVGEGYWIRTSEKEVGSSDTLTYEPIF
jgi:hypothetical protein